MNVTLDPFAPFPSEYGRSVCSDPVSALPSQHLAVRTSLQPYQQHALATGVSPYLNLRSPYVHFLRPDRNVDQQIFQLLFAPKVETDVPHCTSSEQKSSPQQSALMVAEVSPCAVLVNIVDFGEFTQFNSS
jgi:hypothetical protein